MRVRLVLGILLAALSLPLALMYYGLLKLPAWEAWLVPPESTSPPLRKVAGDPGNAYYWCELAEWFDEQGDAQRAQRAAQMASALGPNLAPLQMRLANFYFNRSDFTTALRHTSRTLELTRVYDAVIFSYYRRFGLPLQQVLQHGLPQLPEARYAYFQHLLGWAEPATVLQVWPWLCADHQPPLELATLYIRYLARQSLWEQAAQTWRQMAPQPPEQYLVTEHLYNGGFEHPFQPVPFDWQTSPPAGAVISQSTDRPRSGRQCLKIEFLGQENVVFRHVSQSCWLRQGEYQFEIWVRTDGLTTDQGVYFSVEHPGPASYQNRSESLLRTTGWQKVELRFRMPRPGLATIRVCRDPSRKIDSKIRGTVWIDDASLKPLARGLS